MSSNSRSRCNNSDNNDVKHVANELSECVLNMFENHEKVGKEHVKIIVNYKDKQFNDIDAFVM